MVAHAGHRDRAATLSKIRVRRRGLHGPRRRRRFTAIIVELVEV